MPKDSLAGFFGDLENLLSGIDERLADVPHLRPLRDEVATMLQGTKALAAEQSSLTARRQSVTQQLRILTAQGRDLIVKPRAAIRSHYGHRNEVLVRFHIRPIRRRSRATPEGVGIAMPFPAEPPAASPGAAGTLGASPDTAAVSLSRDGDSPSEP